jgi:hypothetical protein
MIITYNKEVDKLIKDVITDLHYRGITTLFSTTDYVIGDKVKSNGFFDSECREFSVAIGKPFNQWLKTFIHESCHFDQWKEGSDEWADFDKLDKDEDLLWDWVNHKVDLNTAKDPIDLGQRLKKVAQVTREVERDCEMRAIQKIKDYNLNISLTDYARQGWAYITFYDYMLESRAWYVIGKEPYNNESLKALMPSTLEKIGISILTDEMREIYKECI